MEKENKNVVYFLKSLEPAMQRYNLMATERLAEGVDSFRIFTGWQGNCRTINPGEHFIPGNSIFLVHTLLAPYNYISLNKAKLIFSSPQGWRIYEVH
jgi:hypothetical protein